MARWRRARGAGGAICWGWQGTQAGAPGQAQGTRVDVCPRLASLRWVGPQERPLSSHWLDQKSLEAGVLSALWVPPTHPDSGLRSRACSRGAAGSAGSGVEDWPLLLCRATVLTRAEPAQGLGPLDRRGWIQAAPSPRPGRPPEASGARACRG